MSEEVEEKTRREMRGGGSGRAGFLLVVSYLLLSSLLP